MATNYAAKGWRRGTAGFTITLKCSHYMLKYERDSNFSAEITKVYQNGSQVNTLTSFRGDATITKAVFSWRDNCRCWSVHKPYLKFEYGGETVIRTANYEGGANGPYVDGDRDCTVTRLLMGLSVGTTLNVKLKRGEDSSGDTNTFGMTSKKVHVDITYYYDPANDYDACNLSVAKNIAEAGNDKDRIRLTFTGKIDSHVIHDVYIYTKDSNGNKYGEITYSHTGTKPDGFDDLAFNQKSFTFRVPISWCNSIPESTSGIGYARVRTWYDYKNSSYPNLDQKSKGWSNTVSFMFTVPESVVPTIDALDVVIIPTRIDNNQKVNQISKNWINHGCFVQRMCGAKLVAKNIRGAYSSYIKSITFVESTFGTYKLPVYPDGKKTVITKQEITDQILEPSGENIRYQVTAIDSRGRISATVLSEKFHVATMDNPSESNTEEYETAWEKYSGEHVLYDTSKLYNNTIITYALPSITSIRTSRVTKRIDDGHVDFDVSEDGTCISALVNAVHSPITANIEQSKQDINPLSIEFQFRQRNTIQFVSPYEAGCWKETNGIFTQDHIMEDGETTYYEDSIDGTSAPSRGYFDPQKQYEVKIIVKDAMTEWLQDNDLNNKQKYVVETIVDLASNECTMYWKRDGLGIGIGQKTMTNRSLRALEISPDWVIMHGMDDQHIYYVPDIVFTAKGDKNTPKRKIGRIWLKEVD